MNLSNHYAFFVQGKDFTIMLRVFPFARSIKAIVLGVCDAFARDYWMLEKEGSGVSSCAIIAVL